MNWLSGALGLVIAREPEYTATLPDIAPDSLEVDEAPRQKAGAISLALNSSKNLDANLANRQAQLERELAIITEDLRQVVYVRQGLQPLLHHLASDRVNAQEQQS